MSSGKRAPVAWADSPGPERSKMIPIYTPTPDRAVNAIILGDKVVGAYVHYYDRRTRPCTRPSGECYGCDIQVDRRWKGFLAAWDPAKGRWCIVELTREAHDKCPALTEYAGRLRGFRIRLERNGQSKNSRVQAKLTMPPADLTHLPPAFDLHEAIERVWWTTKPALYTEGGDAARPLNAADLRAAVPGLPDKGD